MAAATRRKAAGGPVDTERPNVVVLGGGFGGIGAAREPLRDLFRDQPNVAIHVADVSGIHLGRRAVRFADMQPLPYDYPVLALGASR